jgi:hypothetical protein
MAYRDLSTSLNTKADTTRNEVTAARAEIAASSVQLTSLSGMARSMSSAVDNIQLSTDSLRSRLTSLPQQLESIERKSAETNTMVQATQTIQARDTAETNTSIQNLGARLSSVSANVSNIVTKFEDWHSSQGKLLAELQTVTEWIQNTNLRSSNEHELSTDIAAGDTAAEIVPQSFNPSGYSRSLVLTHGVRSFRSCHCISTRTFRSRLSFVELLWSHPTQHVPSCTFHQKTWRPEFRASMSIRTLGRILELSLAASCRAGGFAISPLLAVTRIVDRNVSPSFQAFDQLHEACSKKRYITRNSGREPFQIQYYERSKIVGRILVECPYTLVWNNLAVEEQLSRISAELPRLFETGLASPLDTDCYGNTLLHVCSCPQPISSIHESQYCT